MFTFLTIVPSVLLVVMVVYIVISNLLEDIASLKFKCEELLELLDEATSLLESVSMCSTRIRGDKIIVSTRYHDFQAIKHFLHSVQLEKALAA